MIKLGKITKDDHNMIKRFQKNDGGLTVNNVTDLNLKSYSFSIFICEVDHKPAVMVIVKFRQMALLYEIKLLNMV